MGIIIRTAFNNQGWQRPCTDPFQDHERFRRCIEQTLNMKDRQPIEVKDGSCVSNCWEKTLCTEYWWDNVLGRWGKRAYPGINVYFVYVEPDGSYTLWGRSEVDRTADLPSATGKVYHRMFFKPFEPLPEDKWAKGLTSQELVGHAFRQGRYRYIDSERETYLDNLIEHHRKSGVRLGSVSKLLNPEPMQIQLKQNIIDKLHSIAERQGREVEELVREAIARWLKEEGS